MPERNAARFFALTAGHVGEVLQVTLCGILINAPKIMSPISGGRGQLLLDTYEEARIVTDVMSGREGCAALAGLSIRVD